MQITATWVSFNYHENILVSKICAIIELSICRGFGFSISGGFSGEVGRHRWLTWFSYMLQRVWTRGSLKSFLTPQFFYSMTCIIKTDFLLWKDGTDAQFCLLSPPLLVLFTNPFFFFYSSEFLSGQPFFHAGRFFSFWFLFMLRILLFQEDEEAGLIFTTSGPCPLKKKTFHFVAIDPTFSGEKNPFRDRMSCFLPTPPHLSDASLPALPIM